jgi:type I restriction enzyme S subunit
MNAYPKYKDSGIDWLGEIPENWNLIQLRYLCDIKTGDKDTVNRVDNGAYPFFVRSPKVERINSYTYDGEAVLMAGDGVGAGKVIHYINGKFDYHQRVYNFHNFNNIRGKFLYYYLLVNFRNVIEEGAAKSTVDSVRLPWLKSFPISIPSIKDQDIIAQYLDKKTAKIDELMAEKTKQVEDLQSYRTSVITEAVTRGINSDAPLRQSGIDWIGEIPEHWKISKAKYYTEIKSGDAISNEQINDSGSYPVYGGGELMGYTDKCNIEANTIIVGRVGARCGCITLTGKKSWATDNALIIATTIDVSYFARLLDAANLNRLNESNAQPLITATKIKNLLIPVSPISEQQEIAAYLDEKTAKIDKLIGELNAQLTELADYKQAVISEAVTGKVDVRNCRI